MNIVLKFIVSFIIICFQVQSYAQLMMNDIKMDQIQQKKIRKYIECQIEEDKQQFSEIHPSWNCGNELLDYRKNEMTFFLKGDLQDIWRGYLSTNPSKSWNGRKISFSLLLRKYPGEIFYYTDSIAGIDTGQVYFLNLKVMHGICNVPVAFEIIKVDVKNRVIEFSYIEGNKSRGVQQIKFQNIDSERIKIIHTSYFKSDSRFRDKWLYPFFHRKIVKDFHKNMSELLSL